MQRSVYCTPTGTAFGRGEETRTTRLVRHYDESRIFVVYGGGSVAKGGLLGHVEEISHAMRIAFSTSDGVVPNPLILTARRMVEEAKVFHVDFILAIDGGSVIDAAKAVTNIIATPGGDVREFWTERKIETALSIGVALMVSAVDPEIDNSAMLTNDTLPQHTKCGINTDLNRPKFAIPNPELTMTLSKWQIGADATDIFIHTAERYFAPILGNRLTNEIAEGLFRDVIHSGPLAAQSLKDYEVVSELIWCGSMSHVGLINIGAKGDTAHEDDWVCRQLDTALPAIGDCTYSATPATVFPVWIHYVKDANPSRFVRFVEKVYDIKEGTEGVRIEAGIQAMEHYFRSFGTSITLAELFGRTPGKKELEIFALGYNYRRTRSIGDFKVLRCEDILNIYKNVIQEWPREAVETVLEFCEFIHQVLKGVVNETIRRDDAGRAFGIEGGVEGQV